MKKLIVFFTLVAIVLIGCDVIGSLGGGDKGTNSYMKFEINEVIYDTRTKGSANSRALANLSSEENMNSYLIVSASDFNKINSPYRLRISFGSDFDLNEPENGDNSTKKEKISITNALNLTITESAGDVRVDRYRPIINEENQIVYQVIDTLNSKYVMGSLVSYMARERLNNNGTLPDTFKVERGKFFVEIIDRRDE